MEPRKIVIQIIDATPGQAIGAEIKALLDREGRYRAILIAHPLHDRMNVTERRPALIVPVLPATKESAVKLLASLGESDAHTPLLPVLRSGDLNHVLDDLALWTDDFLLPPLQAEEVVRDRKSTRLNSSHIQKSRMPSSA